MRLFKRALIFVLLLMTGGCAYIESKQGEWIFRATDAAWWGRREIPTTFVDHHIPVGANGDTVHAWWAPANNNNAPVLLYLHGARWNLSGSVTRIPRWNQMGFAVLAIDYRGFGKSTSRAPTEQSSYEDAEAAWAYIDKIAPNRKKFIFGHSLGGAMATHLAIKDASASGLILEGAFTSVPDMVKSANVVFLPVIGLITQRFDNLARINAVKVPLLIAHGTDDTIVPFAMSEKLYAAATARKYFFRAEGGSHHNLTSRFYDHYANAVWAHFQLLPVGGGVVELGQTR